jgi:hypothetical protein
LTGESGRLPARLRAPAVGWLRLEPFPASRRVAGAVCSNMATSARGFAGPFEPSCIPPDPPEGGGTDGKLMPHGEGRESRV